jgi:hypothetical protein
MKSKSKQPKRNSIQYAKLGKMWASGNSYKQMGEATGMRGNEENDPYKPVRAAISNMLRGAASAWKDQSGKVLRLAPREGMRGGAKAKKHKVRNR